ncbi:taste receptor type 2 member 40-like [Oncorhynchus keta]|uniref:taste receptor type 2 member 40-like n=1 Tax=Oncorhynchus keta TaxID=8018 RepID=UPI0015FCEE44|nr:taste receptor type 2 member 40-like [Oncorhynchus keta]
MGSEQHEVQLYGIAVLVVIGVLWNTFNLITTMFQQWKAGGVQTVGLIISTISLGNVFLHLSTFGIVVTMWRGVLCWDDLPMFFCAMLYVWMSSSYLSFWSIAWLSVLYCVKVVNFTSELFAKIKTNISPIINVALAVTFLNSCVMFSPFFSLNYRNESYVTPVTKNTTCVIKTPLFPTWINMNLYVLVFICYLSLLPVMVMVPSSIRLVVHLCKHTLEMRKNKTDVQSADSYLLVCKLTVALVGVYITTLTIISLFYLSKLYGSDVSINSLLLGYSFYCIASGVLLTISNKNLREKLWALFCGTKASNASSKSLSGETGAA